MDLRPEDPVDEKMDVNPSIDALDLENIVQYVEEASQMEKVRLSSCKHNWENFSHFLRRNLMERRLVLDADDREDLSKALSSLRQNVPSKEGLDFTCRLRTLAESFEGELFVQTDSYKLRSADVVIEVATNNSVITNCLTSWFGDTFSDANDLKQIINEGNWKLAQDFILSTICLIPSNLARDEKSTCMKSLEIVEKNLLSAAASAAAADSFSLLSEINESPYGICQPRLGSVSFKTLFFLNPCELFNRHERKFVTVDENMLMSKKVLSASLSVVEALLPSVFPDTSLFQGEWQPISTGQKLCGAFCLKFSRPIVFSAVTLKKLSTLAAMELKIDGNLNIYQYLVRSVEDVRQIFLNYPGCPTIRILFEESMLQSVNDGILREITFTHPRDIPMILKLIRRQLLHNALFESLLHTPNPFNPASSSSVIDVKLYCGDISAFTLSYNIGDQVYVAKIGIDCGRPTVTIEDIIRRDALPESSKFSSMLDKFWSLGILVRSIFADETNSLTYLLENDKFLIANVTDDSAVKISDSWLCVLRPKQTMDLQRELYYKAEGDRKSERLPMLALLSEEDKFEELIAPAHVSVNSLASAATPRLDMLIPRTNRIHSENTMTINALSDLDAICDMAKNIDDGDSTISEYNGLSSIVERFSPVLESQRLHQQMPSLSPSAVDRYRGSQLSALPQVAPLDISRARLNQSAQPTIADAFEFDDQSRLPSSAPFSGAGQFHFAGSTQAPYLYPNIQSSRGSVSTPSAKRRGRARKVGNIGDRASDQSEGATSVGSVSAGSTTRKQRGTPSLRRPRRSRKSLNLVAPQPHNQQIDFERSAVQRPFSDMMCNPTLSPVEPIKLTKKAYPSATHPSPINTCSMTDIDNIGESSDEETDPPPPAKVFATKNGKSSAQSIVSVALPHRTVSSTTLATTSAISSAPVSSILSPSVSQPSLSVSSVSSFSSTPTSLISNAICGIANRNETHASRPRKGRLEAVLGKLQSKSSMVVAASNPYAASDIYDDESEPLKKPSQVSMKREKSTVPQTSEERLSPSVKTTPSGTEQTGSDLKIMIKIKPQKSPHSRTPPPHSSNISPPMVRLTGQPPSASVRHRDEKALLKQKQLREKSRVMQEERNRKAMKRERKVDPTRSNKKPKQDKIADRKPPLSSNLPANPVLPHPLVSNSLKNFKIPKVMDTEKCESPVSVSSALTTTTLANSSNSAPSSSSIPNSAPSTSLSGAANSSGNTSTSQPTKPKSIKSLHKSASEMSGERNMHMFRSMGMPPAVSGRRPLLPDPHVAMHYSPRPMGPPLRMPMSVGSCGSSSASSGRWMALAPQRQISPRSLLEQTNSNRSPDNTTYSKMLDSPSEDLKIVADDE